MVGYQTMNQEDIHWGPRDMSLSKIHEHPIVLVNNQEAWFLPDMNEWDIKLQYIFCSI